MRIAYIFASRSRPEKFFTALDNIKSLSASTNYYVCAKLDSDDHLMNSPEIIERLQQYPEVTVKWGLSNSKIHAINRDLGDLPTCDILVCMSDDMQFTIHGFDDVIRKHMPENLDSFLHFPEEYKRASVCTMSIIGVTYYNRFGYIYHSDYNSLWPDNEATEVAKLVDRYVYVPVQIYKHNHYSTGGAKDALYKRNDTYKRDRAVFYARRDINFDLKIPKSPFLVIKYATRGRWRLFFDALDNIYSTITTNQFKIIVTADADDVEMNCQEVREFVKRYPNVELIYGERVSKVDAINRSMPTGHWDWCVVMSDDMKFIVPGWDMKMLEEIRSVWPEGTDWFAHFPDGYVNEKLPTMNICGRQYYERFGHIYPPMYKSVSCDAENMFVAMMLGRYHYFSTVYFHHIHPANMRQPSDRTYRENHQFGDGDTQVYFERMARAFDVENPVMVPEEVAKRWKRPQNELRPMLALLIPTIEGREEMLERLLNNLNAQIARKPEYTHQVKVIVLKDNREKTIGEKRNLLTQMAIDAGCTHRAFIDDDDNVTEDYLDLNMPGVYQSYDCNSLVGIYSVNGVTNPKKHIFLHSLKYTHWYEDKTHYYRNPNHLNVVKLDLIKDIKFQEKNFGEDGCWSEDIAKAGVLKTEYTIEKPFYHYLFRTKIDGI